jgi:hypothetical protein
LLVIFGVGRVRLDRCIVIIVDVLSALLQRVIVNLHHLLLNAPGDDNEEYEIEGMVFRGG